MSASGCFVPSVTVATGVLNAPSGTVNAVSRPRLVALLLLLCMALNACSAATLDGRGEQATMRSHDTTLDILPPVDRPLFGERTKRAAFRTAGLQPRAIDHRRPYSNGVLTDGILPAETNDEGVKLYERDGRRYYHPVGIAQFALAKLDVARRTGKRKPMRSTLVNAEKLLEVAVSHRKGLYFPYPFDFPLGGQKQVIHAPWWSAMAQGQALSLFTRLHEVTGRQKWRDAADRVFRTLDDRGPRAGEPWATYVDKHHYLWLEEYAGDTKPLLVLNGHMFAIFGLWDYHQMTGSARAATLFDGAVTLLREYLPLFRVNGEASIYCLRHPFCHRELWQNEKYHGIVVTQMRIIADMADAPWFRKEARRFAADFMPSE